MKKFIKFILILLVIIIITVAIFFAVKLIREKMATDETAVNMTEDNNSVLVVGVEKSQEEEDTKPEPKKDASAWTNEIYALNMEIGTLYIPKTNLKTPIYSSQTVEKMEKMPCFIYTTGGLNRKGVTLITGHNKRNGKLFSNNKKLQEGDDFYFKDYEGTELRYVIYSKYITNSSDTSFLNIDTDVPVMVLSCCTDANNDDRIIVIGKVE